MVKISERKRFWLAVFLLISGIVLVYIAFFTPPVGQVHGSVLGFFGEAATLSGALLGIDLVIDQKIDKRMKKNE